jgi:hypothetical protein
MLAQDGIYLNDGITAEQFVNKMLSFADKALADFDKDAKDIKPLIEKY